MEAKFTKKDICPRETLGEVLKNQRIARGISLKNAARKTLIRYRYLYELEKNNFKALPPEPYGSFFVKKYAEFLGLDSKYISLWYQRETNILNFSETIVPKEFKFSLWSLLKRRLLFILLSMFALAALSLFMAYEVLGFTQGPFLKVVSPALNESYTKESVYTIRGISEEGTSVYLNGTLIESKNGIFEKEVVLKPGRNEFLIEGIGSLNKKTEKSFIIWSLKDNK